jgi:hypothetical protein
MDLQSPRRYDGRVIRMVVAQLDFGQTVLAGALNALFTAVLVTAAAGLLVKWFEGRAAERRLEAEAREAERRRELEVLHAERMQEQQHEHQTRAELRRVYTELLVKQRRSREASRRLAAARQPRTRALAEAEAAYADFIDAYHGLNLDASRVMSRDARVLQKTLSDLYRFAKEGPAGPVQQLADDAKAARQNLEGSFRTRLGYEALHDRNTLTDYHDPNPDEPV